MKSAIRLFIIPTFKVNYIYNYYEYKSKANEDKILDVVELDQKLAELQKIYDIAQIDITGGEPSLLSDFYFDMLFYLLKTYCKKVNVYTDFIKIHKSIINHCDIINVNFNFNGYSQKGQEVFNNIQTAVNNGKIINLKSLDISCDKNQIKIIKSLNDSGIKSWEIIPYHQSIYTSLKANDYSYTEDVIRYFLLSYKQMKFAFQNKLQMDSILPIDNYNTKIVYITPYSKYAIQEFNKNKQFQLLNLNNIEELQKKLEEMEKIRDNFCDKCDSKLLCLANRHLNLNYDGKSCSGFRNLIYFYRH